MSKIFVITGGPGTGKTSVIDELRGRGFRVLVEAAREISISDERFIGKSVLEADKKDFQDAIFELQKEKLSELKNDEIVFSDRGLGDTLAYYKINGLEIPGGNLEFAERFRYDGIFVLDFLDFYETDELRQESKEEQERVHNEIIREYEKLGYEVVIVPFMSVEKRVEFIEGFCRF